MLGKLAACSSSSNSKAMTAQSLRSTDWRERRTSSLVRTAGWYHVPSASVLDLASVFVPQVVSRVDVAPSTWPSLQDKEAEDVTTMYGDQTVLLTALCDVLYTSWCTGHRWTGQLTRWPLRRLTQTCHSQTTLRSTINRHTFEIIRVDHDTLLTPRRLNVSASTRQLPPSRQCRQF
jgi:hypothetical protein